MDFNVIESSSDVSVRANNLAQSDRQLHDYLIWCGQKLGPNPPPPDTDHLTGVSGHTSPIGMLIHGGVVRGLDGTIQSAMPSNGWDNGVSVDESLQGSLVRVQQREAIDWSKCPAWATSYRAKYNHRTGETVAEWFNEFESQYAPTFFQLQAIDRGRVLEFKFAE